MPLRVALAASLATDSEETVHLTVCDCDSALSCLGASPLAGTDWGQGAEENKCDAASNVIGLPGQLGDNK